MGTLKMTWNREKGLLVCHWVDFGQRRPLSPANVPASAVLTREPPGPTSDLGRWRMPTSRADQIAAFRH